MHPYLDFSKLLSVTQKNAPVCSWKSLISQPLPKLQDLGFRRHNNICVQTGEEMLLIIVFKRR